MRDGEENDLQKTRADINVTSVEFLLIDADVALTFVSIAEHGSSQETVDRNKRNARKAYDTIQQLRPKYLLSDAQGSRLSANLNEVRARLEALGEVF